MFLQDKDKGSSNKTPKLDRSDGVKEMKEKAPKRKLPFTVGANGDQKDSDSGKGAGPALRRALWVAGSRVSFCVFVSSSAVFLQYSVLD